MNNSTVNFTTPESSTAYFFGQEDSQRIFVLAISFLFGFPTHSYVIWLIISAAGSGVASDFFILNLSFCEIGGSLNALFSLLSYLFSSLSILTVFLQGLGITGRPLFQCLISVERYLAVNHPVTFLKCKPLRYRVICCTAAWIFTLSLSLLFSACIILSLKTDQYVWFFSAVLLLFLSVQMFCLVAVLRALKRSGPGQRRREREEENHMKKRAFYLILITTVNMIVLYVPFIIIGFYVILAQQNIQKFWFPSYIFYALAGFVQPVLYLQRVGKLLPLVFIKRCFSS